MAIAVRGDRHEARLRSMFMLAVFSSGSHQNPATSFHEGNHLAHLHERFSASH
jgi:hypothetical protein